MVVKGSCRIDWSANTIDLVSGAIHKSDLVSADAEEPFDTVSDRLSAMRHVVIAVAEVGSSVGTTAGAAVVVVGHRISTVTLII